MALRKWGVALMEPEVGAHRELEGVTVWGMEAVEDCRDTAEGVVMLMAVVENGNDMVAVVTVGAVNCKYMAVVTVVGVRTVLEASTEPAVEESVPCKVGAVAVVAAVLCKVGVAAVLCKEVEMVVVGNGLGEAERMWVLVAVVMSRCKPVVAAVSAAVVGASVAVVVEGNELAEEVN